MNEVNKTFYKLISKISCILESNGNEICQFTYNMLLVSIHVRPSARNLSKACDICHFFGNL